MKRHIAGLVLGIIVGCSFVACGNDPCGQINDHTFVKCGDNASTVTFTAPSVSTEQSDDTTTTTPTVTSTVTETETVPPATTTETPATQSPQSSDDSSSIVMVRGAPALCRGQRIDSADADNVKLFGTRAWFHPGGGGNHAGFEFSRVPDFPIAAVLITYPDSGGPFNGYIAMTPAGVQITDATFRQSLRAFMADTSSPNGFVFCDSSPTLS